jgi:DNA repair protein RecN (Recombination protein N)
MLLHLDIHNVALIDRVSIELGEGLNILTGETGAGKSIIIDSINSVLGGRVSKDLIRTGKDRALVEAVFQLDDGRLDYLLGSLGLDPEEDGTVLLSREVTSSGKSTCRINGKLVTVSMLREIGEKLIDIHGQHDNQSLLKTENHLELLDSFDGDKISKLKANYVELLNEYRAIRNKLRELSGDMGERERRMDLLRFQIEEIKKSNLKPGEEEELKRQRKLLSNAEKIIGILSSTYDLLYGGRAEGFSVTDAISSTLSGLGTISDLDERYSRIYEKIETLTYQLEDVVEEIRNERDRVDFSPELLEETDERLDLIFRLKRKYGNSIEDINAYCKKCEVELQELIDSTEISEKLQSRLYTLEKELYDAALKLNASRNNAAKVLESQIGKELAELEMKNAQFKVSIEFNDEKDANGQRRYTTSGLDKVEFLFSANAGEPLKPLSKIASGGEMARVMLAIKTILADVDRIPTLIFDEIDSGISGKAANKVGEKLSYISGKHQVICVTHLTQIACMADNHFLIEKTSKEGNTYTMVKKITGTQRRDEIARLLGGISISPITIQHAEEMLNNAQKFKRR